MQRSEPVAIPGAVSRAAPHRAYSSIQLFHFCVYLFMQTGDTCAGDNYLCTSEVDNTNRIKTHMQFLHTSLFPVGSTNLAVRVELLYRSILNNTFVTCACSEHQFITDCVGSSFWFDKSN